MTIRIGGIEDRLATLEQAATQHQDELRRFFRWPISTRGELEGTNSIFADGTSQAYALSNFVFQGGGILGIAHLGFLFAMEHIGVRALGAAGTSAGAIVALLLAAARGGELIQPVAKRLLPVLWTMPAASFIDGPYAVRRLVKHALKKRNIASLEMSGPMFGAIFRLLRTLGLNPGYAFEQWLSDILWKEFNIQTVEDLERHLHNISRQIPVPSTPGELLKVVATALPQTRTASIPIGVKFTFPQDLQVLATRYRCSSPALLARASMSVPFFFDPLTVDLHPTEWRKFAEERLGGLLADGVLDELSAARLVAFIDGGMLSNFPIDAFLRTIGPHGDPSLYKIPTVGVTLVSQARATERVAKRGFPALIQFTSAAIDGMRHARDRDALAIARLARASADAPDIVIAPVDTGRHNWLNFQLDESELSDLFLRGIDGAIRLLKSLRPLLHT